jgi:hypothetical protein
MEIIERTDESIEDNKIIEMVMSNRQQSENYLRSAGFFDEWRTWNNMYRNIAPRKPYSWMSNKFIPMTQSKCETSVSNLMSLLFAGNPPFQVRPRQVEDEEQAKIMQMLLAYQLDQSKFKPEYENFLRSIVIYGTGIGKIIWDWKVCEETVWEEQYKPLISMFGMNMGQMPMGQAPVVKDKVTYGGPTFVNKNIGDIFPDPQATDIQDSWVVDRLWRTLGDLRYIHEKYPDVYNDKVLLLTDADNSEIRPFKTDILGDMQRGDTATITRAPGTANIELNEWHGLYDLNKDGKPERCVFTVANGKYLIRKQSRPYWHGKNPFVKSVYIPVINEFYGIGIPEILEDIQNNLNEIFNQRNDNISFCLNKPIMYKNGASIKTKNLVLKPGGLYGSDEDIPSSIVPMNFDMYTRDAFQQTGELERWGQEVTAVTKVTMGMADKGSNDTATGMSILQRASGDRFTGIARGIEATSFTETLRMYYQLNYQFASDEMVFSITRDTGTQWYRAKPEEIRKDYDFIPSGIFSMENKGQKGLRLIQFKQVTQGDPTIKQNELNKKIYSCLEIGDNPAELIRTDGEMQEIMMLAQQMAMKIVMEKIAAGEPPPGGFKPKAGGGSQKGQFKEGVSTGQGQLPPPTPPNAGNPAAMP